MPGHSRSKNGVASARLCAGHLCLWRGWPGQARPWRDD